MPDIYLRMDLAWKQGITDLHVERDSKVLIDMVAERVKLNGSRLTLVLYIRHLLAFGWQVILSHIWLCKDYANSKYFHSVLSSRRRKERVILDNGLWFDGRGHATRSPSCVGSLFLSLQGE
ncbi:hypothetical protein TSUD_288010 [Trifolium subterraneum]|uniref:RNase H type-1 domain-containing protein n=1 Tax=Trifolium subterraneum TaxID=3900 RepID=A0A2Z6PVU9_TRISU|nr:hypothetical protein TSUD_288010 [Trifolium subterraneum]